MRLFDQIYEIINVHPWLVWRHDVKATYQYIPILRRVRNWTRIRNLELQIRVRPPDPTLGLDFFKAQKIF